MSSAGGYRIGLFAMTKHDRRSELRSMFSTEQRVILSEDDLDTLEDKLDTMNGRISKLLGTSVGILVSVVTMCIMLALNLIVGR